MKRVDQKLCVGIPGAVEKYVLFHFRFCGNIGPQRVRSDEHARVIQYFATQFRADTFVEPTA